MRITRFVIAILAGLVTGCPAVQAAPTFSIDTKTITYNTISGTISGHMIVDAPVIVYSYVLDFGAGNGSSIAKWVNAAYGATYPFANSGNKLGFNVNNPLFFEDPALILNPLPADAKVKGSPVGVDYPFNANDIDTTPGVLLAPGNYDLFTFTWAIPPNISPAYWVAKFPFPITNASITYSDDGGATLKTVTTNAADIAQFPGIYFPFSNGPISGALILVPEPTSIIVFGVVLGNAAGAWYLRKRKKLQVAA